jgi:hypothetical protein
MRHRRLIFGCLIFGVPVLLIFFIVTGWIILRRLFFQAIEAYSLAHITTMPDLFTAIPLFCLGGLLVVALPLVISFGGLALVVWLIPTTWYSCPSVDKE